MSMISDSSINICEQVRLSSEDSIWGATALTRFVIRNLNSELKEWLCGCTKYLVNCYNCEDFTSLQMTVSEEGMGIAVVIVTLSIERPIYCHWGKLKDLSPENITKSLSCSTFALWQGQEHCHAKTDHDLVNTPIFSHSHPTSCQTPVLNKLWHYPRGNLI